MTKNIETERYSFTFLENLFNSLHDSLRTNWDSNTADNILLTLFFYKRLLSLAEEGKINFIKIDKEDFNTIKNLNINLLNNSPKILSDFRYTLINIARQNSGLENIFTPLVSALEKDEDLQLLARVFVQIDHADFTSDFISVETFGTFFNSILNSNFLLSANSHNPAASTLINQILVRLTNPQKTEKVYIPSVGQANLVVELNKICPGLHFILQEKDLNNLVLGKMNLMANGIYHTTLTQENALISANTDSNFADLAIGFFPFGQQIETRLIKNRPYLTIPFEVTQEKVDSTGLLVQLLLYKLKADGRMSLVLPLTSLNKDDEHKKYREYLLRRDWIESVITFPAGILAPTEGAASIILINKQKQTERAGKILFINASNLFSGPKNEVKEDLQNEFLDLALISCQNFQTSQSEFLKDYISIESVEKVIDKNCSLDAKRYAAPFIKELELLAQNENLLKIAAVLKPDLPSVWVDKSETSFQDLPYLSVRDMATSFADFDLETANLSKFKEYSESEARLINQSVLLVNKSDFKINYFEHQLSPLLCEKDILVFGIDDQKVRIEYLILQLHSQLIQQQIEMYRKDHPDNDLTESDFQNLQFVLPELSVQDNIIKKTKLNLLQLEEQKVENLRDRLNLDKIEAQNKQTKILSSLHHELGNKLPAILNDFKNLKDFILDKANNGEILQMNESIVPFFEEFEEANEKDSLSSMLERLETLIVHAITSVDATGSIVKADKDSMKPEKLDLKQFLLEIAGYYRFEDSFKIKIEHTQDEPGKDSHFYVLADKAQLTTLFTNLIENAARHGFVEQKKYQIVFCIALSADKKYVVIDYKNDGLPFSDSFSFQDFISYGRYAGSKGNSGIGGYLINQIVENHDGKIFYREKINKRDPFNVRFEIFLPNKIIQ